MGSLWRAKDTVYLAFGALLLILFALGIASGVSYYYGYPYPDPTFLGRISLLCVPAALVPGLILIFMGLRARRHERDFMDFVAWIKTYRRIGLNELARKLGKAPFEAERILVHAVDRGLVAGFIDRATEEFVLQEAVAQEQYIESCPRCGGNLRRRYFLGETVTCPYCNAIIASKKPSTPL